MLERMLSTRETPRSDSIRYICPSAIEKRRPPKSSSGRYLERNIIDTKREPFPMNWPASMKALFAAFDDLLASVIFIFWSERMALLNFVMIFLNVFDLE
jgi:hypothetical protein